MKNITDNQTLENLLSQSQAEMDVASLDQLIEGVAAAPVADHEDEWMALVSETPSEALKEVLRSKRDEVAHRDTGLDGERTHPERIAQLRAEMKNHDVDGFIVPTNATIAMIAKTWTLGRAKPVHAINSAPPSMKLRRSCRGAMKPTTRVSNAVPSNDALTMTPIWPGPNPQGDP